MARPRSLITPEEAAERSRLMAEYQAAGIRAGAILAQYGMDSPEFLEADKATGAIWRRIREIDGTAGSRWMA
jgi:hypothetical protein